MRLRTFFFIGAILLVLLGVGATAGLLWMTTLLKQQTETLAASVGRVRAAEELRQSLFLLQVVRDVAAHQVTGVGPPITEAEAQRQVQGALLEVERYTNTPRQVELVANARAHVGSFLRSHGQERLEELRHAVDASETIVAASLSRSQELQEDAVDTSDVARTLGGLLGGSVLAGIALILYAAHARLYRPILSIREVLVAFKSGQRERRVVGTGVRELRELAAEFNDMAETLVSQDARHLQFLAGVVHDLRSPLNVLKLSAQVLLRPPELPAPEKVRESLTRILTQLGRLERMVGDLMEQTRAEAGNLELRWEECDVRDLVSEVVELHRPSEIPARLDARRARGAGAPAVRPDAAHPGAHQPGEQCHQVLARGGRGAGGGSS